MKKSALILLSLCALSLFSCQKETKMNNSEAVASNGPTSFIVSVPETRTVLNNHSVLWVENDEIRVFGVTDQSNQGSAVFQYTRLNEDGTVLFEIKEGETLGEYANYYAAYPAIQDITVSVDSKGDATMTYPRMNSFPYNLRNQRPVASQFDPKLAILTAKYDGERLAFRHGVGYVKVTVPYDDVTSIDINFEKNCLGDKPTFNLESGMISSLENSSKNITASVASVPFVKGQSYYLAAIPRSGYTIGNTTVTYTIKDSDNPVSVSTGHFSGKSVEIGKIFDLGAPTKPTSPKITYTLPSKLAFDVESGSFAYNVQNPVEGVSLQAQLTEGDWIDASSISVDEAEGTVSFSCSKNDAADAEERTAVITLSYEGAESVPVTVTQGVQGSSTVVNTYVLYVNSNKTLVNTKIGDAYYFNTGSGTSVLACDENNYFGAATSYEINGVSYRYARKLDGSNPLSFTVSEGASATLKFYCARREKTKTTTIALNDGSTNIIKPELFWDDERGQAILYESDLINLTSGKTYSFAKSGDNIGIFYIEVVETIN